MTSRYPAVDGPDLDAAGPIVAIASSAGGVLALSTVLAAFPVDLAAPVLVVQHLHPTAPSHLPTILQRACELSVHPAAHRLVPRPGRVYVAPPGRHLVVGDDGRLELHDQPPVRFLRPCADLLFESVARRCGRDALAVVLSGSGRDGAAGVIAIRIAGGDVVVQDPATAQFAGMPSAALESGSASEVWPLGAIGREVVAWCGRHTPEPAST